MVDIIGLDVGFGFTKGTNGKDTVLFKSVLGDAADIQYREPLLGSHGPETHLHLELNGQEYFVGDLAERQSATRSFTLDHDKLVTGGAKPLGLTALALRNDGSTPIRLVAGLPINQYRRHKKHITEAFQGRHEVTLIDALGERRVASLNVQQVRVIPQPYGSLYELGLDHSGRKLAEEKVGIIDVGFRTTDLTIADRMRYSERGSRTTDAGISQAFASVAAKLQEKSGVSIELYRLFDAVMKGSIRIRGKGYDLRTLTEKIFAELAAAIALDVDRLWAEDWDIDAIVLTGGGGAILGPHLKPLLNGDVISPDNGGDPRLTNVKGYRKYGTKLWRQVAKVEKADKPAS